MTVIGVHEEKAADRDGRIRSDGRVRLLVVDHAPTRFGVRIALGDGVEIVGETGDPGRAVELARETRPDVCLLGLELPGAGVDAICRIADASPSTRIIAITAAPNDEDFLGAMRAGAIGYVPAGTSSESLLRIVTGVAADEAAVPRMMVPALLAELREREATSAGLTAREAQILTMLRRGETTARIAARLEIAPVTVRRHISQLVQKLGVDGRDGLRA